MDKSETVCILYMEDDLGLARLVQKRMKRAGYNVDIAADGKIGLEMYETGQYDVIAVDQNMPGHSGLEVIKILSSKGPLPPVVMITGAGDELVAVEAIKMGAGDYVIKDVDGKYLDLLPGIIERLLERQHLIEEKKQAEDALRESEAALKSIFRAAPTGIGVLCDRVIKQANKRLCEIVGYSHEELLGKSARMLHPTEKDFEYVVREQYKHIRERGTGTVEIRWQREDGKIIDVLLSSTPIDPDDFSNGVTFTALDITDRKQAEKALRKMYDELEQRVKDRTNELETANQELSQYAYVVSHDLKAPLRAIRNYADFLREDLEETLEGEQQEYFDGLQRAVRQGDELIDALLKYSRIGESESLSKKIDISAFLHELTASLNLPADVEVVIENDWPVIDTDPTLLRQIYQNLISNAVKFNHSPKKRIELGWRPFGKKGCKLFIRDNGIGIEPRYQSQIFNVFQRLHTRQDYEGTGIGLAIVKKLAYKLNASVIVESNPGKGSTFFITVPQN